uniref:Uncharacterized protein n=1 Tax=Moniliophthora roreri TaxID=221103 RepID=A0A0W0F801_MONRR
MHINVLTTVLFETASLPSNEDAQKPMPLL